MRVIVLKLYMKGKRLQLISMSINWHVQCIGTIDRRRNLISAVLKEIWMKNGQNNHFQQKDQQWTRVEFDGGCHEDNLCIQLAHFENLILR